MPLRSEHDPPKRGRNLWVLLWFLVAVGPLSVLVGVLRAGRIWVGSEQWLVTAGPTNGAVQGYSAGALNTDSRQIQIWSLNVGRQGLQVVRMRRPPQLPLRPVP
jgi:hypothetical protein